MFGEDFTDIPVVEVSLDGTFDPLKNWAVGQAVNQLRSVLPFQCCFPTCNLIYRDHRDEQILVLSGGLTIHNLRDFSCFAEDTAKPAYLAFNDAILDAVQTADVSDI